MRRNEITSESLRALCKELGLVIEEDEDVFNAHFADIKLENDLGDILPLFSWDKDEDFLWAYCDLDLYLNGKTNEYRELWGNNDEAFDRISDLRKHCRKMIDLHNKTRLMIKMLKTHKKLEDIKRDFE